MKGIDPWHEDWCVVKSHLHELHSCCCRSSHEQHMLKQLLLGCTCRLDGPFGTAEKPVEVPSMFDHRVVGVPDPDDDSLVW